MRTILSCHRSVRPQLRDHAVIDTVFHNHVHHSIKQLSLLRGKPLTTYWGRTTSWIKTLVGATVRLILSSCFYIFHARLNYTEVNGMPVVDSVIKSTWMKHESSVMYNASIMLLFTCKSKYTLSVQTVFWIRKFLKMQFLIYRFSKSQSKSVILHRMYFHWRSLKQRTRQSQSGSTGSYGHIHLFFQLTQLVPATIFWMDFRSKIMLFGIWSY